RLTGGGRQENLAPKGTGTTCDLVDQTHGTSLSGGPIDLAQRLQRLPRALVSLRVGESASPAILLVETRERSPLAFRTRTLKKLRIAVAAPGRPGPGDASPIRGVRPCHGLA